jgi:thiaminase/transcriptional activator TenA
MADHGSTLSHFREQLWSDIGGIFARILEHPFVIGLMDGSLPPDAFRHYLIQDSHYLHRYARVLAMCAGKADELEDTNMFARHAAISVATELHMHAALLTEMGCDLDQVATEPVGPTTRAYLSFLTASACSGSFGEALGAVLPCYWIGAKLGELLRVNSSPNPLYARWIDNYADEAFQGVTEEALGAMDRASVRLPERERDLVRDANRTAARYEWMFWDASYRRETWPV